MRALATAGRATTALALALALALAGIGLGSCGAPPRPRPAPPAATPPRPPAATGAVQRGIASWYGRRHHGRRTASGERYNRHAMTAAHRTLPMNTRVRVTNRRNGRSVIVRINDRGPFAKGRIIDLSEAAAAKLDMIEAGIVPVTVERLR